MYSWLVTVLLLASEAYCSGGARVPITSYTCTHPDLPGYNDDDHCTGNMSTRFRTCEAEEGASHVRSIPISGLYGWRGNKNPFMVLDIPQGWCVGSVEMTFPNITNSVIPTLSLSVHSAERLYSNTDRTAFSIVSEEGSTKVVLSLTPRAHGRYLRIDMTFDSAKNVYLQKIEVLGTSDSICTHSSSAGGNPASPTTSVGSSTHSVIPIRTSLPSHSAFSAPASTPSQAPSVTPRVVPIGQQDNYVIPAAISAAAVLLVVVLVAIFAVVICTFACRHGTEKTYELHNPSVLYRSSQSDVKDNQSHVGQTAEVPTYDRSAAVGQSHDGEIEDTPYSYAAVGPSAVQSAARQPAGEDNIRRPAFQASPSEISSGHSHGKVASVLPSTLDHPSPVGEGDELGHYETSPQWQLAVEMYDLPPNSQLPDQGPTTGDSHKLHKDAKPTAGSQGGTTHQLHAQAPHSAFPIIDPVYDTADGAAEMRREPDPRSSHTYVNVNPPSSDPMLAAAQTSECSNPPKPPRAAKSLRIPQEDHIYTAVDMSRKKSASSVKHPPAGLTRSTDATDI